ncbi:MAG: amidohydrolase, partial [Hyphomicrobiales bacterium]
MTRINRREFLGVAGASALAPFGTAFGQSGSLSDMGKSIVPLPMVRVFTAREIVTLDPARPAAEAVAVVNGRILLAGSLEKIKRALKGQRHTIDTTFAEKVIVPGFIAQHDHPLLAALTMSSEVLAIEDWVLP